MQRMNEYEWSENKAIVYIYPFSVFIQSKIQTKTTVFSEYIWVKAVAATPIQIYFLTLHIYWILL